METGSETNGVKGEQPDPEETEISEEESRQMLLTQRDNIKIVLQSKLIVLSPLKFEDYPGLCPQTQRTEVSSLVRADALSGSGVARAPRTNSARRRQAGRGAGGIPEGA